MKFLLFALVTLISGSYLRKREIKELPVVELSDANPASLEGYGMMSEKAVNGTSEHAAVYKAPGGRRVQLTLVHTGDKVCIPECVNGGIRVDIRGRDHVFCCAGERSQPVVVSDSNEMVVIRETVLNEFTGPWNIEYLLEMTH